MKVLDLFSGIGGFSLGLERAGMETVAFCEVDKHCQKVLKKHWPNVPIFEDVRELSFLDFEEGEIDVICGGFPCQDISVGGKGLGILKGERSRLWFEYWRLIDELRPSYIIIENVAKLIPNGLEVVLRGLNALGYDAEWHVIPARSVNLLHQRERVWVISYPRGERQNERSREKRLLQVDQERKNPSPYRQREGRELESLALRPILSRRAFERLRDSLPDSRTFVSGLRRVFNGIPEGMDERRRKERIKQLGNAVVPQIPQVIGEAILEYEKKI